jgi:hypothetical protein
MRRYLLCLHRKAQAHCDEKYHQESAGQDSPGSQGRGFPTEGIHDREHGLSDDGHLLHRGTDVARFGSMEHLLRYDVTFR